MPIVELQDGRRLEFQNDPTPEDVDFAVSQLDQQQPGSKFLSDKPLDQGNYNLDFTTNLALGFSPSEEATMGMLQEKLQGKNVSQDQQGNIMVDGQRINPRGFDLGDITRNAGYAFNLAGEILGGTLGFVGGGGAASPTGVGIPAGAVAGAIGGATVGNTFGEGIRLAMSPMFGFSPEADEVIDRLKEEAIIGGTSEAIGLATLGVGGKVMRTMGPKKFFKGFGEMLSKPLEKVNKEQGSKAGAFLSRYLGKVDPDAAKIANGLTKEKFKPSEVLNEIYFDPAKTTKTASRALFGKETTDIIGLNKSVGGTNLTKGVKDIAESVKRFKDDAYDGLVVRSSNGAITEDTLSIIKNNNLNELFSFDNLSGQSPFKLANRIVKGVDNKVDIVGKAVGKAESSALKSLAKERFNLKNTIGVINRELRDLKITKGIKEPGFQRAPAPEFAGKQQLQDIVNLFKAAPTKKMIKDKGLKIKHGDKVFLDSMSMGNVSTRRKQFDILVDSFFKNKSIAGDLKNKVRIIAKEFRSGYFNKLGMEAESRAFRELKEELATINITGRKTTLNTLENTIKGFGRRNETTRGNIDNLLRLLDDEGVDIGRKIQLSNAADQLTKVNPESMLKNLESQLSKNTILKETSDDANELALQQISDAFKGVSGLAKRSFMDDAKKSLAAKAYLTEPIDVLRISAVAAMTGLGGLTGGPVGGVGALGASLIFTSPKNIARFLVKMEKRGVSKITNPAKKTQVIKSIIKEMERSLRKTQGSNLGQSTLRTMVGRGLNPLNQ